MGGCASDCQEGFGGDVKIGLMVFHWFFFGLVSITFPSDFLSFVLWMLDHVSTDVWQSLDDFLWFVRLLPHPVFYGVPLSLSMDARQHFQWIVEHSFDGFRPFVCSRYHRGLTKKLHYQVSLCETILRIQMLKKGGKTWKQDDVDDALGPLALTTSVMSHKLLHEKITRLASSKIGKVIKKAAEPDND